MLIRHSEKADIPAIKNIYQQPTCYAGTLQLPYPSLDKWQKFLSNIPENFHSLVAEIEGTIVGQLGMEVFTNPRRKHVANIGMAVDEDHQEMGVGSTLISEAISLANNWLGVNRIELEVYVDNQIAIKMYEKHGFIVEGTAKNYALRNGQYTDVHLMARVTE
jgi:putative acetyltransferase